MSISKVQKRSRDLRNELENAQRLMPLLQEEVSSKNRELDTLRKRAAEIEKLLETQSRDISVSDHALVRYIERVKGFDVDALRHEILSDEVRAMIDFGASRVQANGATYVIKDRSIVTIT